ncbi:hypothetical protein BS78_03G058300 [Paspalum vaginatum]|nr:hypothetical protein BS78_03G058300 [Paspalum vaginatum]
MEIEVESTWKGLFQRRLVMAAKHCRNVHALLFGTLAIVDGDVRDGLVHQGLRAESAQRALESATMELGFAVASMGAARHLALRGGAPCPSAPLDSVDDLAGDPAVWCALERLQKAAALATGVHDGVECARGRLLAAAVLVDLLDDEAVVGGGDDDSTGPQWKQSPCFSEQIDGMMELGDAVWMAEELAAEADGAREAAFGFGGGGGVD